MREEEGAEEKVELLPSSEMLPFVVYMCVCVCGGGGGDNGDVFCSQCGEGMESYRGGGDT